LVLIFFRKFYKWGSVNLGVKLKSFERNQTQKLIKERRKKKKKETGRSSPIQKNGPGPIKKSRIGNFLCNPPR
jgi:hypothetical protein